MQNARSPKSTYNLVYDQREDDARDDCVGSDRDRVDPYRSKKRGRGALASWLAGWLTG